MTCAECQDLLLDLAYGELDPVRKALVESHVRGCEACKLEQAVIARSRSMVLPLMTIEEPPASMDEPILRAAHAEAARLTAAGGAHDKSPVTGPRVVEVAGSIGAFEAAAPVSARAQVHVQPTADRPRRRWAMRVALGGSVAAAAGLVLIVSNTDLMRARTEALSAAPTERAIRIRVPDGEEAARADGEKRKAQAELKRLQSESDRQELAKAERRAEPPAARAAPPVKNADSSLSVNFGDDTAPIVEVKKPAPPAPPAKEAAPPPPPPAPPAPAAHGAAAAAKDEAPPASAPAAARPAFDESIAAAPAEKSKQAKKSRAPAAAPSALGAMQAEQGNAYGRGASASGAAGVASVGNLSGGLSQTESQGTRAAASATMLESRARNARTAQEYVEAARLYQRAAQLHRAAAESGAPPVPATNQAPADPGSLVRRDLPSQNGPADKGVGRESGAAAAGFLAAAWDVAHAIECYAADARFDDARRLYEDLLITYPGASGPQAAAQKALRSVLPPRSLKSPARSQDDADSSIPVEPQNASEPAKK